MLAADDSAETPIPLAIETPRGLLVAVLRATRSADLPDQSAGGRPVSGAHLGVGQEERSHVDAMALANILRTDAHLHRMLPDDSPKARSISVLARAYQDGVWQRTKLVQELRARHREFYPASWLRSPPDP